MHFLVLPLYFGVNYKKLKFAEAGMHLMYCGSLLKVVSDNLMDNQDMTLPSLILTSLEHAV